MSRDTTSIVEFSWLLPPNQERAAHKDSSGEEPQFKHVGLESYRPFIIYMMTLTDTQDQGFGDLDSTTILQYPTSFEKCI